LTGTHFRWSLEKSLVEDRNVFLDFGRQTFVCEDDRRLADMLGAAHHETDRKWIGRNN